MDYRKRFRVEPGAKLKLADADPAFRDVADKDLTRQRIDENRARLSDLQMRLYAEHRHSVLILLQGLDTAGKDGVVRHILGALNPLGCTVTSFKVPTPEEAAHDFLWRCHKATPGRGWVAIFNRTYYEAVLVERVHELVPKKVWSGRYDEINAFEHTLRRGGTTIIKFFLHISKQEQLERFRARLDDPAKRWKISEADYSERAYWDDYMAAYQDALERCSTEHAPWYVIPADHKHFRDLAVSSIVADTLDELGIEVPQPTVDITAIRRKFHEAQRG